MKVEYSPSRPAGVTQLMSVGGGLGDVLDDTAVRLRNAAIAGAAGYLLGRVFRLSGDKPLWTALGAFGIFLVK